METSRPSPPDHRRAQQKPPEAQIKTKTTDWTILQQPPLKKKKKQCIIKKHSKCRDVPRKDHSGANSLSP
ncbi:MAG: hypothetical protein KDA88_18305, partial [Planctomycetaceae bacterium]|nr:hypothetical protein [Planctomycetaceae bacterium]